MHLYHAEGTNKAFRVAITHVMRCDHSQRTRQAFRVAITPYKSVLVLSMGRWSHTQFFHGQRQMAECKRPKGSMERTTPPVEPNAQASRHPDRDSRMTPS
eukprot:4867218-Amphidinium_carterae.1